MYDIRAKTWAIMVLGEIVMENIISFSQEIFMLKENNSAKIGLADFRAEETPVERKKSRVNHTPKELRLSDLMRKGSC